MTAEGLPLIYNGLDMLYPEQLDVCLTDIPVVDAFITPPETLTDQKSLADRLAQVAESARHIETDRRKIAYQGSVLRQAIEQHPSAFDTLPEDTQAKIQELVGRMATPKITEKS